MSASTGNGTEQTMLYFLVGGPLDGASLDHDPHWRGTARISCDGWTGRYVPTSEVGQMIEMNGGSWTTRQALWEDARPSGPLPHRGRAGGEGG